KLDFKISELLGHFFSGWGGLGKYDITLEMAEGVEVVAVDVVLCRAGLGVVEMVPGVKSHVAFSAGEHRVNLGPLRAAGVVHVPDRNPVVAAHPVGRPGVSAEIVIEGGEVGVGLAVMAVVVENRPLVAVVVCKAD